MLKLDRTPWHMTWVGVRPQRARRRLDRARVSARTLPVERSWSFRRRAPRHRCQPCLRGSRLSSRVPPALSLTECVPPQRHALGEDSPADGNVSRAGDECGGVGVGTKRRFDEARLAWRRGAGRAARWPRRGSGGGGSQSPIKRPPRGLRPEGSETVPRRLREVAIETRCESYGSSLWETWTASGPCTCLSVGRERAYEVSR